jgi:hypothetical protein
MKRISVFTIAILVTLPVVAKASYYPFASRHRVRWSPYTHGLVYGDVQYSPYAYKRGSSGLVYRRLQYSPYANKYGKSKLVYDNVRYSPYAFGYKRSGLISYPWGASYDYHYSRPIQYDGPCVVVYHSKCKPPCPSVNRSAKVRHRAKNYNRVSPAVHKPKTEQRLRRSSYKVEQKELNAKDVIEAFLTIKNIDYKTNRILSIEKKLISIDFELTDRNIIIKYWNPKEILALKKQKNSRIFYYDNYLESYREFCSEYLRDGGQIHQIVTADNKEILKKLFQLDDLEAEQKTSDTTAIAKANEVSNALQATN